LEVRFTNKSENGDPGSFEWFFFKDLDEIKRESEQSNMPVDSIMFTAFDDAPIYTYENSGSYMVKLVSKKKSEFHTCTDTVYLPEYIVADTSFIQVPNVFSPNGDGTNDNFVVKFWSMKEVKISVFNRWGRLVHVWQSGDVRGFKNTWIESVWDGKIGGRYASPGVYFYVVEGFGRDGRKRWKHGDIYLFRGKD
jgi:gliding motility-associated-like protein